MDHNVAMETERFSLKSRVSIVQPADHMSQEQIWNATGTLSGYYYVIQVSHHTMAL